MRDNIKIYDTDTHMSASAETIEPYLSARVRELMPDLDGHKVPIKVGMGGAPRTEPYKHNYRIVEQNDRVPSFTRGIPRILGEGAPRESAERRGESGYGSGNFRGQRFPTDGGQEEADIRIKDMDEEGVDVQVMVPRMTGTESLTDGLNSAEGNELLTEFIAAHHRHLNDMCNAAPHRLRSLLVVTPQDVEGSVKEVNKWGPESWSAGVRAILPLGYPIDHPDLHPIWKAAQEHNLPLVHHSLTSGYPGYRDLWENPFLGRAASHPWAAMRFLAAVTASGMMDKFPELRIAILESGFGWIPFWAQRLDDQLTYMGHGGEDLKHPPSYYLTNGRFFAAIEMHEGPGMMRTVNEAMGDGVLMLGTDYPHAESYFPESVNHIFEWRNHGISEQEMQKLLWDNAVRCFGEP